MKEGGETGGGEGGGGGARGAEEQRNGCFIKNQRKLANQSNVERTNRWMDDVEEWMGRRKRKRREEKKTRNEHQTFVI